MADKDKHLSLEDITASIEQEGLRWHVAQSEIALLSPSEQKKRLGVEMTDKEIETMESAVAAQAEKQLEAFEVGYEIAAPAQVDWTKVGGKDYVKEAKNQGSCGSCVSFGTCATIEANIRIKAQEPNRAVDLSEAFCQFCGGGSCSGWGLTSGLAFAKSTGITDEACMPYEARNMNCESERCSNWQSRLTKIKDFTTHAATPARKNALATIGPVVAGMAVYNDFFGYGGGIYEKSGNATLSGYHCISVVGYNDPEGYWIIKNSWGTGWGMNGFCNIAYGQVDLKIDSSWAFYSVDLDVTPTKGSGPAQHLLVDKYLPGTVRLWAYAGSQWRSRTITDTELTGLAQDLFTADRVDVWWDGPAITLIRGWQSP